MTLYVYRSHSQAAPAPPPVRERVLRWSPSLTSWRPPGKGLKYGAYTMLHWLRVFGNRDYCWLALADGGIKASMLCVPAYRRWPFMAADDIQFAYVLTDQKARGQGWGARLVAEGIAALGRPGRQFWYVTDSDNVASQKLATRSGLALVGTATSRTGIFRRLELSRLRDA